MTVDPVATAPVEEVAGAWVDDGGRVDDEVKPRLAGGSRAWAAAALRRRQPDDHHDGEDGNGHPRVLAVEVHTASV